MQFYTTNVTATTLSLCVVMVYHGLLLEHTRLFLMSAYKNVERQSSVDREMK